MLATRQPEAGFPATLTDRSTGGRQEAGPVTTTRPCAPEVELARCRPGSSSGATSSLSPRADSTDQATQPRPLGDVVSWGWPPAKVPGTENRTMAACRVSARFSTATASAHTSDASASLPLASATTSWPSGEQLLRSPVSVGVDQPALVSRDTTGW